MGIREYVGRLTFRILGGILIPGHDSFHAVRWLIALWASIAVLVAEGGAIAGPSGDTATSGRPVLPHSAAAHKSAPNAETSLKVTTAPWSGVARIKVEGDVVHFQTKHPNFFHLELEGCKGRTVTFHTQGTNYWATLLPVYSYDEDVQDPRRMNCGMGASFYLPDSTAVEWRRAASARWTKEQGFEFQITFEQDRAVVASRVPYTPEYLERFVHSVRAGEKAVLHRLVYTQGGQSLYLLEFRRPGAGKVPRPTVLMYAREHANEHDGSWVVQGAMEWLLSDDLAAKRLLGQVNVLLLPVLDPEGAAKGDFDRMTDSFWPAESVATPEANAVANWLKWDWIDRGERLDLTISVHNVQSGEGPTLFVPQVALAREKEIAQFNAMLRAAVGEKFMRDRPQQRGKSPFRLGGYCLDHYGPLALCYEINSQSPQKKLSLNEMGLVGKAMLEVACQYLRTPAGARSRSVVDSSLRTRAQSLAAGGNIPGVSNTRFFPAMLIELSARAPKTAIPDKPQPDTQPTQRRSLP
jgi:hypothetical protein